MKTAVRIAPQSFRARTYFIYNTCDRPSSRADGSIEVAIKVDSESDRVFVDRSELSEDRRFSVLRQKAPYVLFVCARVCITWIQGYKDRGASYTVIDNDYQQRAAGTISTAFGFDVTRRRGRSLIKMYDTTDSREDRRRAKTLRRRHGRAVTVDRCRCGRRRRSRAISSRIIRARVLTTTARGIRRGFKERR